MLILTGQGREQKSLTETRVHVSEILRHIINFVSIILCYNMPSPLHSQISILHVHTCTCMWQDIEGLYWIVLHHGRGGDTGDRADVVKVLQSSKYILLCVLYVFYHVHQFIQLLSHICVYTRYINSLALLLFACITARSIFATYLLSDKKTTARIVYTQ